MAAFSTLNKSVESQTGLVLFSGAEDLRDGILHVTATEHWLSGRRSDQASNLDAVFKLWQAADGSGLPIAVYVLNADGDVVMKKTGR